MILTLAVRTDHTGHILVPADLGLEGLVALDLEARAHLDLDPLDHQDHLDLDPEIMVNYKT